MEPVTTAILGALAAGAATGATETGKKVVADAYQALKGLLKSKFGEDSKVAEAVGKLEDDPESPGWRESLSKEVGKAGADQDPDIVAAAQALLDRIKELPAGEQHIQHAVGSNIAQADRGSTATVTVQRKD